MLMGICENESCHMLTHLKSIARYMKLFREMSGIDITIFTTHFVPSASTIYDFQLKILEQQVGKVVAHLESTANCQ